jgi:hypothetical protein
MGLPQQLPPRLSFFIATPFFVREFYGTLYWFISGLITAAYHDADLAKHFLRSPILNTKNFILELFWSIENFLYTFLSVVADYSEVMACLGLVLILFSLLFILSTTLKALEKLTSFSVTWFVGYFQFKHTPHFKKAFRQYKSRKFINKNK